LPVGSIVVVVVVVKVMFAHSYSYNSHERAKEESYALVKSSVLRRLRNAFCSDRQLVIAEWCRQRVPRSWSCNGEATRAVADFLWLGRRGHHVQLILGIGGWGWQRPADIYG